MSVVSDSLRPHGLWSTRLLCPWDFPGKNTEVGCHFLLQGIFLLQGSNPHPLHWQADSLPLSHREAHFAQDRWDRLWALKLIPWQWKAARFPNKGSE